jgi:hypothetical protein
MDILNHNVTPYHIAAPHVATTLALEIGTVILFKHSSLIALIIFARIRLVIYPERIGHL